MRWKDPRQSAADPGTAASGEGRFAWLRREDVREILIVRFSALGDVIHVLPSLAALRETFPRAHITWLVDPLGATLLEGHPALHRVVVLPRKRWRRWRREPRRWPALWREVASFAAALRRPRFDLVIDFQGNFRSGLAVAFSGGRHRLGFHPSDCREFGGWVFTSLRADPTPLLAPKVLKNLELVRALGWTGECPREGVLPIPEDARTWARDYVATLEGSGPLILVHPAVSAFGAIKQWPPERFRELCGRLARELGARVVLTWGPGEEDLVRAVGNGAIAPPTPELLRLAALVADADAVVAADTGCLHLAAAVGTPWVGLYGPKSAEFYRPYPATGEVVQSRVPCSPCRLRVCEHRICMWSIPVDEVFEAVEAVLARGPVSPVP
jgi:lipopolysaccharide heptosyltransferase I